MLDYVASRLQATSLPIEHLGVLDVPAEDLIHARRDALAAVRLHALVERSRALVIGTPVYNASIPGGLKALLDLLPERALHGKTILVLATGGSPGHQLAIEYSLKPVLSALGARHVLAGVFACETDVNWSGDPGAAPAFSPALGTRLDEATDALCASLGIPVAKTLENSRSSAAGARNHCRTNSVREATFAEERCSA